jgi:hypothetical protein
MASQTNSSSITEEQVLGFFKYILKIFLTSFEVYLRTNIGERYHSFINVSSIIVVYAFLRGFSEMFSPIFSTLPVDIFFILATVLGLRQLFKANRGGETEIHSFYSGRPVLLNIFPSIKEENVKLFVEPILLAVIGAGFFVVGRYLYYPLYGFGLVIFSGGVLLYLKEFVEQAISRSQYLDALDKKIESEELEKALSGKYNASETKGFAIPKVRIEKEADRRKVADMYRALDPSLQQIMERSQGQEPPVEPQRGNSFQKEKEADLEC